MDQRKMKLLVVLAVAIGAWMATVESVSLPCIMKRPTNSYLNANSNSNSNSNTNSNSKVESSNTNISGRSDEPQPIAGGYGRTYQSNDELQDMVDDLYEEIEDMYGEYIDSMKVVAYRSQVVAGTNYVATVRSEIDEEQRILEVTIFKPLGDAPAELVRVRDA